MPLEDILPVWQRGPVPGLGLSGRACLRGAGSLRKAGLKQGWGVGLAVGGRQRGGVFPGQEGRKLLFSSISWPDGRWDTAVILPGRVIQARSFLSLPEPESPCLRGVVVRPERASVTVWP